MKNLSVGVLQLNTEWEDPTSNKTKIEYILNAATTLPSLVILPEMFLTGFSCDSRVNADLNGIDSQKWLSKLCLRYNIALIGSAKIVDDDGHLRNRLFLSHGETIQYYDKRHLFPLSSESKNFTSGDQQKIFKLDSWSICPQICYDLRFPVWSRNSSKYDVLVNVANWPAKRKHAWQSLLIARAIENQAYVIGVNRTGIDANNLEYGGDSLIISPEGDILLDAKAEQGLLQASLSMAKLEQTRIAMPFLKDMDTFSLHGVK